MDQVELSMLVDIGLKFYAVPSQPTSVTMRSMSLVVDLIDLVTKHKSGELRCPATALIVTVEHSGEQHWSYSPLTSLFCKTVSLLCRR